MQTCKNLSASVVFFTVKISKISLHNAIFFLNVPTCSYSRMSSGQLHNMVGCIVCSLCCRSSLGVVVWNWWLAHDSISLLHKADGQQHGPPSHECEPVINPHSSKLLLFTVTQNPSVTVQRLKIDKILSISLPWNDISCEYFPHGPIWSLSLL